MWRLGYFEVLNIIANEKGLRIGEIEDRYTTDQIALFLHFFQRDQARAIKSQHAAVRNAALEALSMAFSGS